MTDKKFSDETRLTYLGRDPQNHSGTVNPPVYHASTIVFPSMEAFENRRKSGCYVYGRRGTPNSDAFEQAVAEIEGGFGAVSYPSGLAAIAGPLLACLNAGDHLLMVDTAYDPAREICDTILARYGIETEYYDPRIGAGIEKMIRNNTKVIYMESPGSVTFEIQDVPAIVAAAQKHGITTILDNTWAAPVLYKPLAHGVNISIIAATKYICGHSDVSLGVAVCDTQALYNKVWGCTGDLGICAGPDDLNLGLRGLRTAAVRMKKHGESALKIAQWLENRPEVSRVFFPALPSDPNHELWKRDFSGVNGILSMLLPKMPKEKLHAFIDGLELFALGYSWGGYESLIMPENIKPYRTAVPWTEEGHLIRLQIGLENTDDLIADLEAGFARLGAGT